MIYAFDSFELDTDKVELRQDGNSVSLEPQVFSLLLLLVENRERMVSRDEIVEKIWDNRIVSDSAVASRIKSLRKALGDDGKAQRFVRTVHSSGFRFVAEAAMKPVKAARPEVSVAESDDVAVPAAERPMGTRPSLAVLPFRLVGIAGPYGTIADALPRELIAELSRLRWLFVIASGSSFRFREADPDVCAIGARLGVRYCMSGVVTIGGNAMAITVELADTNDGGVIWAEHFAADVAAVFEIRARIIASIIAALEIQIPLNEARLARLKETDNLDAWSAYHLAIQHMFRFNREDNQRATALFTRALADDPGFARAHAGLSFTHFQNAFLRYSADHDAEVRLARQCAERGVELDPMDAFVNFTMGRVFWLEGEVDGSLVWLDRANMLRPSYAEGVYARAWADTVSGRGAEGQANADLAMSLSPLDPLFYAMLASRALSHVVRGDTAEAAVWAERAARSPGAHVMISLIAVVIHALNGDPERAAAWAASARQRSPRIGQADFFRSFPFADLDLRRRMARVLTDYGF